MYELRRVGENTYYIDCPAKMGAYLLPENKAILIDSGNDKEAGKKILKIFAENGWTLEAIVNTHSNADHIGGNRLLHERTGCKIYATALEAAFGAHPALEPSFLYGGWPCKPLRNKFLMAEPSRAEDIAAMPLPEGMEIFPLRGHYFDMIGVKTPDDVWFMADCVSSERILEKYHVAFIYDVAEYLKTLDFAETLEGRLFIPAHTEPAEDMRRLCAANRAKVREIIANIKEICESPATFEGILKALFDRYNLTMDFNQYVLAGSTVRSYLSYMLDSHMLGASFTENQLFWHSETE
jgi:glyoxylase-like metal-dependent hydrolase (beta-lactamase superfamily II)